ncbi:MAG: hypothetical protein AAFZ04_02025 [Pseudomonadota bacterium]
MVKLLGERDTDSKAAQAIAELHLSLDHGIKRLDLAAARDITDVDVTPLLALHKSQSETLDDMLDIQGAMADTQKTWSQWLNETIATAADPAAGLDSAPIEAITTSETRILDALDACMRHIATDPLRSTLEHMKRDTLDALEGTSFQAGR